MFGGASSSVSMVLFGGVGGQLFDACGLDEESSRGRSRKDNIAGNDEIMLFPYDG